MRIYFRGFKWFFRKNWYSLYRWKHPAAPYGSNKKSRCLDIGAITVAIDVKDKEGG